MSDEVCKTCGRPVSINDAVEQCDCEAASSLAAPPCAADARDQRLMLAEEILSNLATGYWVSVLDDNDDPVKEKMGQRVLNYWRKWDSPPNDQTERPERKE